MALTHKFTLICDDVRVENNGKLLVIGMYGRTVLVPQLPFAFASLTFLQFFEGDGPQQLQFRATLQHLDSGQTIGQAMGVLAVQRPGPGVSAIRFQNITVTQAGSYIFAVNLNGAAAPITENFDVVLVPPAMQVPPTLGRPTL